MSGALNGDILGNPCQFLADDLIFGVAGAHPS